jgi:hypothetical protein
MEVGLGRKHESLPGLQNGNKLKLNPKTDPSQPMVYQIRIQGHLGRQWTDWFEGLTITLEDNGDTLVSGPVVDDAALHGLLKKVRDLGMPLLSVNRVEPARKTWLMLNR